MELVIIVLLIIAVIGLGIGLAYTNYQTQDFKIKIAENESKINDLYDEKYTLQMKNDNLREDLFKISEALNLLELQANLTADEKNKLETELKLLQENYFQLKESISISAVKNDSVEDLEVQLANLRRIIDDKVSELERLDATAREVTELMNQKVAATAELEAGMRALEGRILSGKKVLEEIDRELIATRTDLANLMQLKASVLVVEEGAGSV